jgi:hypothetical protein
MVSADPAKKTRNRKISSKGSYYILMKAFPKTWHTYQQKVLISNLPTTFTLSLFYTIQ